MPFNLGFGELFVLALVAIVVFGGQLPDVARKVGRGITDFKRGMSEQLSEIKDDLDLDTSDAEDPEPPADWEPPAQDNDCPGMS